MLPTARRFVFVATCIAFSDAALAGFVIEGTTPYGTENTAMGQFQPYEKKGAATFKNPEPGLVPQQRRYENAELVVDLAYQSVTQTGPTKVTPVEAFADDVPFAEAMMMVLPSGWQLYKDKTLEKSYVPLTISFTGNKSMPEVLRQIGDRNGLKFHIDWYQNTVMLSKGRSTYASSKSIKIIPEPVKVVAPVRVSPPTTPVAQAVKPTVGLPPKAAVSASGVATVSTPAQSKVFTPQSQPKTSSSIPVAPKAPVITTLNIQPGSLRANLERLSKENGWKEPSWKDENDYMLKSSFTVTGKNFAEAVSKLLYYNPTVEAEVNTAELKIYVFEGKGK